MKALSIRQPWAFAIFRLGKDIENRTWATAHRGLLVIHAASRVAENAPVKIYDQWEKAQARGDCAARFGALIGFVEIVGLNRAEQQLMDGKQRSLWGQPNGWHWLLKNPHLLAHPIPYRGHQHLFDVEMPANLLPDLGPAG